MGRERPLAEFATAIADARLGRGRIAFVSGEAGIGKTRLAEEVAAQATTEGMPALWGRCYPGERPPAYWPWIQVIRAWGREHDPSALLAGLGPAADDVARLASGDEAMAVKAGEVTLDPEQSRFRLYDSLATFLRKVSDAQPTVVVLDDLHGADPGSLEFLRFLTAEIPGMRMLVMATFRDDEVDNADPLASILAAMPRESRRIALEGLTEPEVAVLVEAVTGVEQPDDVVAALHARSGGNPFFVRELAQLGLRDIRDPLSTQVPSGVREVISQRLAKVSHECTALLETASVAGQQFDLDLLVQVSDAGPERIRALLEEAAAAGLVVGRQRPGRYAFAHALVRETLYAGLGDVRRELLHYQIGEALAAAGGEHVEPPLTELARHFLAALPSGDVEAARTYALRAAEQARARLAHEEATFLLSSALELVRDDDERLEVTLALAEAQMAAGDWPAASDTYAAAADLARALDRGEDLARAALGLGAGLGGFEVRLFDQRQIDLLEEALRALGEGDSSLRAWVTARLSVALSFVGSEERRSELAHEAVDMARRIGDPAAHAYALSTYSDTIATPEHAAERLAAAAEMVRLARQAGDRELELLARRFHVVSLLEAGDVPALDAEIEAFAHVAETLKHPISQWYVPLFRGTRALMEGRFEEAERLADRALAMGQRAGSQNAQMLADFTQLTELYRQSGRLDEMDHQYHRFVEAFPPMAAMMDWISLAMCTVGRGDGAKVRAELERLAAAGTLAGMAGGGMWLVITNFLAEAAAAVRHRQAAEVLFDALRPFSSQLVVCGIAGCIYGAVARAVALLADVLERDDDAEAYFEEALHVHARAGALPYLAHTQREYAAMLLRRGAQGDEQRAEGLLDDAMDTYRRLGMKPYLAMAEALKEPPDGGGGNAFLREGQYWSLTYQGQTVRVRDSKGVRDIAYLLAEPGREFHVSDLIAASDGVDPNARGKSVRHEPGLVARSEGGAGEALDEQARAAYRARVAELQEELDEAERWNDPERADRARAELDFIAAELSAAYGLGGRARSSADPGERARKAATRRIRRAIETISEQHPALGRHLQHSVHTGVFCSYQPESPVAWTL